MAEDTVLEAIEVAKATGKIKKGSNEVTKALEKQKALLVAYAKDVDPKEVVMHLPLLSKEKGVPCFEISTKEELGAAAGIEVGTAAVAIVDAGESKKLIEELGADAKAAKEEKSEAQEKEVPEEKPAEEKKEEAPEVVAQEKKAEKEAPKAEEKAEEKPEKEEAKEKSDESSESKEEKKEEPSPSEEKKE